MNNKHPFSIKNRSKTLENIENRTYDLCIIGGGITGVGIALDAASRGLKTLLLEQKDFAFGTSSRSTKLIHGGLRYLKQFEIGLVREVGIERAILHKNAPHLVHAEKMILPIIEGGSLGKWGTYIGLSVYDRLADVENSERRKMISDKTVSKLIPSLKKEGLIGGGLYYEYRTDDARLVIEVAKTAAQNGAELLNYAEVSEFNYTDDKINGLNFIDKKTNQKYTVNSKSIVNATGPWVDELRAKDNSINNKHLQLTKGVHLVFSRERFPLNHSVYFDVDDGRMIFAIPRGNVTYAGTTDTFYKEDIATPTTNKEDRDYVLEAINDMFSDISLTGEDVQSSWAGLRPLIHEEGKSPSELSRKDEIFVSKSGLITIAGGKLTGFRKMAQRTVNEVYKSLDKKRVLSTTKDTQLSGGNFGEEHFNEFVARLAGESRQIDLSPYQVKNLVYKYGSNTVLIIEKAYDLSKTIKNPLERIIAAEVWYAVNYEMVADLSDFVIRRTGRLYFERPSLEEELPFIKTHFFEALNLPETEQIIQSNAFEKEYLSVLEF